MNSFWVRILGALTDEELVNVDDALWEVQNFRTAAKVRSGDYPAINEVEKGWLLIPRKIEAIKSYKHRTGCTLRLAKYVMDHATENLKNL